MALCLDHAFIICSVGAPEAQALISRGFIEGSGNVHAAQGTANRRFFFENFMLELLWVADPVAAAADVVRPTGLWERWSRREQDACRFGVVYGGVPAQGSPPPFTTKSYHPAYLPPAMSLEIVLGLTLQEPALFCIPSLTRDWATVGEPRNHAAPVRSISAVAIGLSGDGTLSRAAHRVRDAALLDFYRAPAPVLEVRFCCGQEVSIDCRPELPLLFRATR
jgi:hypothetical protein